MDKKKKQTIKPTLREKKRYVLFEIVNGSGVSEKDFYFALWHELLSVFGSVGMKDISLKMVSYKKGKGIMRCKRGKEKDLIAGLAFIKKAGKQEIIVRSIKTSGSIKKLKALL